MPQEHYKLGVTTCGVLWGSGIIVSPGYLLAIADGITSLWGLKGGCTSGYTRDGLQHLSDLGARARTSRAKAIS